MIDHSHREYIPGCFRCDLSRDEVSSFDRVVYIDFDDDGADVRAVSAVPAPPDESDWDQ